MPYYHVVFTLPAPIAAIAYQNKAVIYAILFKAAAETLITIAADPKHLGARIGLTAVLHTWGSALTHHPHVHCIVPGGGISLDGERWISCRPGFFLPVRVLSRLFRRLFLERLAAAHEAGRLHFFGDHAPLADPPRLRGVSGAAAQDRVGRLRQAPLRRARGGAGLSLPLHAPRRHRQQPADRLRRQRRHLQLEGLPRQGPRPAEDHDPGQPTSSSAASSSTSCPAASTASATTASSPTAGAPRTSPAPANCSASRPTRRASASDPDEPPTARAPMPVLRWPHDHHRDLRARLNASHPSVEPDQNRHIMMPLTRARRPIAARPCRRSSTGEEGARSKLAPAHAPACHLDRSRSLNGPLPWLAITRADPACRPNPPNRADRTTTANATIPIARRITTPTRPAVSSLEASRTPAARACRLVHQRQASENP